VETTEILALVFRWLHVLAAITAAGGAIFARFAVLPALEGLPEEQRRNLHEAIRGRWAKFVHASILILLVTGLYNFMVVIGPKNVVPQYHMVFGIKFVLALVLFALASILMGRSSTAQKLRQNARTWLTVNVVLAVAIVCMSGYLRSIPRKPTIEAQPAPIAAEQPVPKS